MVEYVLSTWKMVSYSSVEFRVCDCIDDITAPIVIAYGFNQAPITDRKCVTIVRKHIKSGWKYTTLSIEDPLREDPRLKGETLPVFEGTFERVIANHESSITSFNVDLIFNAFAHLAFLEELQKQRGGRNKLSYAAKLREDRRWLHKPVVNYYFAVLERCLELMGIERHGYFPYADSATICLTHDVDVLRKNATFILKQSGLQGIRLIKRPFDLLKVAGVIFRRCIKKWRHDGIDIVSQIERRHNVRSTFFVSGARAASDGDSLSFSERLIEPAYDIVEENEFLSRLVHLAKDGWEIGLHGGSVSHVCGERLRRERRNVEDASGVSVVSGRQHWLSLSHDVTWKRFADADIQIDSSLGFNDMIGFRSGLCHPHHPYIIADKSESRTLSLPMITMDSTLFDYNGMSDSQADGKIDGLLAEVCKFSGTVSVLWHTHGFLDNYGWADTYERLIDRCSRSGIRMRTVREVYDESFHLIRGAS